MSFFFFCKIRKQENGTGPALEGRYQWEWGGGREMIYFIHCKNLCKCHNVPSTTIKNKKFKLNICFELFEPIENDKCYIKKPKRLSVIINIIQICMIFYSFQPI
jgi:hypothetical protein